MKIAIDKNELVQAIDTVIKAVPTGKVVIQALEGILIEANVGKLKIVKNNLESAIEHTIPCEVILPGKAIVNAKMICDIVRKMPDEELDIVVEDKKMTVEAGKAVMKVPVIEGEYPGLPDVSEKARFEIDKKTLVDAINGVAFAVFEGEEKPTLTGINITIQDGMADIVAIDGYMMAYRKISLTAPNSTALLCGKSLENVVKSIGEDGTVTIILSNNMAMFTTEDTRITVRAVDGTYMNYKRLQTELTTKVRINARELVQSLERALLVFEAGAKGSVSEPLKITSKGESLNFTMNGGKGTFDEEIFCSDISGEKVKIGLDPRRVLTCLKHIDDKEVMLGFAGDSAPMFIMPVEGDGYKYMVMAVRTRG